MTVTVEKPQIISLLYRQEKTDADYGSCLWARFYLDLKNYTMQIESDCGMFSYGWRPTPNSESFLHLLSRLGQDYLLGKLSSQSVIDGATTFETVKGMLEEIAENECMDLDPFVLEQIESACYHTNDGRDVIDGVLSELEATELWNKVDSSDLWECVEYDYPANAKKIVSVFASCIKPVIKTMED